MKTIYKYPLSTEYYQTIEMPQGAKILTVQTQNNKPCLWVMVYDKVPMTTRKIKTYGIGNMVEYGDILEYIGTYQIDDGMYVFHVFEDVTP